MRSFQSPVAQCPAPALFRCVHLAPALCRDGFTRENLARTGCAAGIALIEAATAAGLASLVRRIFLLIDFRRVGLVAHLRGDRIAFLQFGQLIGGAALGRQTDERDPTGDCEEFATAERKQFFL